MAAMELYLSLQILHSEESASTNFIELYYVLAEIKQFSSACKPDDKQDLASVSLLS